LADVCLASIDLEKAYDTIYKQDIWKVLHKTNVSSRLKDRIKNIYENVKTVWSQIAKNLNISEHIQGLDRELFSYAVQHGNG
jgi:hypothetical protein